MAATVADVLTVAHAQGIVLGALTPASILLTADGPKVVDLDAAGGMAPVTVAEPVRSRRARGRNRTDVAPPGPAGPTPAEDIRALGAVLREMVSGPGLADLPPTLPALWQACLGRDDEQPDAPSLSLELWGLLTPQLAATGSRSPNAPRAAVESRAGAEERTAAERAAAETAARARGTLARAALDRKPRPAGPGHPPAGYAPAQSVPDEYPPDRYTVDEYPADGYGHEAAQAIALDYPGHGGRHRRRRPARADPGQAPAATGRG